MSTKTPWDSWWKATGSPRAACAAFGSLGLLLCASPASAGSVIGATPRAAALAATAKYAAHEIQVFHPNYPGLTYKLGNCKLLFRRPWVAWGCAYETGALGPEVGAPRECVVLKLALKRLLEANYRATVAGIVRITHSSLCPPWP